MAEYNNKDIDENSELHKDEEEQQRKDNQRPEQIVNKAEDIKNKYDNVNRVKDAINKTKENKANDSKSQPSNKTHSKKNKHNSQSTYDRYKEKQSQRDAEKKAREKREAEKKSKTEDMSKKEKKKQAKQDYYDRHKHSDPSKSQANIRKQRNERRAQRNAEKQALNQGAKAGATTGKAAVTSAGTAVALPIIIIIIVVILLIILIIGIFLFFQNMPGEILGKVKDVATNLGIAIRSRINGDSTNISKEDEIELAQYLENMGYDVEGYGFADVTYNESGNDTYGTTTSSGKAKNIVDITPDSKSKNYLRNYMAADQSSYFKAQDNVIGFFRALLDNIGSDSGTISTSADYSTGMIEIDDTGTILDSDAFVKNFGIVSSLMKGATTTVKSHVLTIKNGKYNYAFQLDGWTSKYGRPLELFLALHLSTMMPDLTSQIATSDKFSTKVHIGLEKTKLYAKDMKVIDTNGNEIKRKEIFNAYIRYLIDRFESEKAKCLEERTEKNAGTMDKFIATAQSCIDALNGIYNNEDREEQLLIKVKNASEQAVLSTILQNDGLVTSVESDLLNTPLSGENSTYISGITDTQLNELVELYAYMAGGQNFKLPFITRVSKNWFWDGNKNEEKGTDKDSDNNVYFTGSDDQYTGVYKTTKALKKWITYFPNDKSSLKGFKISLRGLIVSNNGKDLYYQVNEPLTEGPNPELLELFSKKYYKYDGEEETARKIAVSKALDAVNGGGSSEVKYYFHGEETTVTDDEKEQYSSSDGNQLATKQTPSIGTKQDTLSSFEILKNMDTEDSEIIYRMLKQFVTSDKLASVIGSENVINKASITQELKQILIWPFEKNTSEADFDLGTTSKDKNKYGLIISDVNGLNFEAPIDCEVTKVDGTTVTLKLGSLSDKAYSALSFKYRDDFYSINKDLLNGWTMIVKGISGAKTGNVSRGDTIGKAEDKVTIVMQRVNKTVIGGENDTNEDNIENYMDKSYTKTEENDIASHGIADERAPIIEEEVYKNSTSDPNGVLGGRTNGSNGFNGVPGLALLLNTTIDRDTFIADVRKQASQSNTATQSLASAFVQQAGVVYDICVEEGINPVWVAAQSFWESHWVSSVYNYYGMLRSIGHPIEYSSLEEGLRAYIRNIKNRLDPTTSLGASNIEVSKQFSQYNSAFTGGLNTVYDVFANYVGEGNGVQGRANRAYEYLHDCIMQKIKDMFGEEYLNSSVTTNGQRGTLSAGEKGVKGQYTTSYGRTANLYTQGNPASWANNAYGYGGSEPQNMAWTGCGPTALAIIASEYDSSISPEDVRHILIDQINGGRTTNLSEVNSMSKAWNILFNNKLSCGIVSGSKQACINKMNEVLKGGGQVWLVVGPGLYTSSAHCIALLDYNESTNQYFVAHGSSKPQGWQDASTVQNTMYSNILYIPGGQSLN